MTPPLSHLMSARLRELAGRSNGWKNFYWPDFPSLEALLRRGLVELIHDAGQRRTYEITQDGREVADGL